MQATWIWCMAKTMPVAPQRRPSSKQASAIASIEAPAPPSSRRDVGRERVRLAQRVDRLAREARLAVDLVGVRRGDLVGDPADGVEQRRVGGGVAALIPAAPTCSSAAAIEATLSKTLRFSIESRNSTSKVSSSAIITLTLACEVIPA